MKQLPKSKTMTSARMNYLNWYRFLRSGKTRPIVTMGNNGIKQAWSNYKDRYLVDYYAVDIITRYSDNRWIESKHTIGKRIIWKRTKLATGLVYALNGFKSGAIRIEFNTKTRRWGMR